MTTAILTCLGYWLLAAALLVVFPWWLVILIGLLALGAGGAGVAVLARVGVA